MRVYASVSLLCLYLSLHGFSFAQEQPCAKPKSTAEQSECVQQELRAAETEMNRTFQSAISHYLPTAENEKDISAFPKRDKKFMREAQKRTLQSLKNSQEKWGAYRESACSAVGNSFEGGTLAAVAVPSCKVELTQQRTAWLKSNFGDNRDNED